LTRAAWQGHPQACEALLKAGADPSIANKDGQNSLHSTISSFACHDVIPILLSGRNHLLNAKDRDGYTPLMLAALYGKPKACKALLIAGADRSISKGGGFLGIGGTNALDLARQSTSPDKNEVIELLTTYKK